MEKNSLALGFKHEACTLAAVKLLDALARLAESLVDSSL